MDIEYTLEYKEYGRRELYFILENGKKIKDFWNDVYTALYIDRNRQEFRVAAISNVKEISKLREMLIDLMIDYLNIDTKYKVCTFCSVQDDMIFGYELRDGIKEKIKRLQAN